MSAILAAIAEFRPRVQRQLWAVVDGPSARVMPVCCAASDGREEPIPTYSAEGTNDDSILIAAIRFALHSEPVKPNVVHSI
jgi:hypothetical protein